MSGSFDAEGNPWRPRALRVLEVVQETSDVFTLALDPGEPFHFGPGQFNMVSAFGSAEVPLSISGSHHEPERLVHTIRAVGAATRAIASTQVDDFLGVRGPLGVGWSLDGARGEDVIVLAGGLGIAPLRPLIYALLRERSSFGAIHLLLAARSTLDLPFRSEIESWSQRSDLNVIVTFDRADASYRGRTGVITKWIPELPLSPEQTRAFCCGPEIMMRYCARELERKGLGANRISVTLERNMACGVGLCGRCQLGPELICRDGPVFAYDRVERLLLVREL